MFAVNSPRAYVHGLAFLMLVSLVYGDAVLQKHTIDLNVHPLALCNDGSPAVYYTRSAGASQSYAQKWMFILEGGGYCCTALKCAERRVDSPRLISSNLGSDIGELTLHDDIAKFGYDSDTELVLIR